MKESNIPADNMKIKQLMKFILLTRKWQYMKESNILTGNATIKELERVVLLNRKGQYINDWIILTDNYESGKNSLMSIVITCKSIIGIIFFNLCKTNCIKKKESSTMNQNASTQNRFMSIVITRKSIIGITFFNLSQNMYVWKSNQAHRIRLWAQRTALWALSSYAGVSLELFPSTSARPYMSKKVQELKITLWWKNTWHRGWQRCIRRNYRKWLDRYERDRH